MTGERRVRGEVSVRACATPRMIEVCYRGPVRELTAARAVVRRMVMDLEPDSGVEYVGVRYLCFPSPVVRDRVMRALTEAARRMQDVQA